MVGETKSSGSSVSSSEYVLTVLTACQSNKWMDLGMTALLLCLFAWVEHALHFIAHSITYVPPVADLFPVCQVREAERKEMGRHSVFSAANI